MALRDYQQEAVRQIRQHFIMGRKRVLLWMGTGLGKTEIFSFMLDESSKRGNDNIIVVRGRELVANASGRLMKNKVRHGVLMANYWLKDVQAKVQVASIDTISSRGKYPPAKFIVIDEAHMATTEGYITFCQQYPDAFILSVTATPFTEKSLAHLADAVVHPITMQQGIDQGYLIQHRYYAPSAPDLKGVKTVQTAYGRDYESKELAQRMGGLTGDVFEHWNRLARGRPTLGSAVNVLHSKTLTEMFISKGVRAEHCDATTKDAERKGALSRLASGETEVIFNVGLFGTGIDVPRVSCVIQARPTKSYSLYVQQLGRGTRPVYAPGPYDLNTKEGRLASIQASEKHDCMVLDHAGNVLLHGLVEIEPEIDVNGKKKGGDNPLLSKICKVCGIVYRGVWCPDCPQPAEMPRLGPEVTDGDLKEFSLDQIEHFLVYIEQRRKKNGFKPGWKWRQLVDRFGFDAAKKYLPEWFTEQYLREKDPFSHSHWKARA